MNTPSFQPVTDIRKGSGRSREFYFERAVQNFERNVDECGFH